MCTEKVVDVKFVDSEKHKHLERYAQWAGNPKGRAPDFQKCCAEVYENLVYRQCSRSKGHGPNGNYCKQHAKAYMDE